MKVHVYVNTPGSQVIGASRIMVARDVAQEHDAAMSSEQISLSKTLFESINLKGANLLIDVIQSLEDPLCVVSYFGFTFDEYRLLSKPLRGDESDVERSLNLFALPHPQWGAARGTRTVLSDLVLLSEPAVTQRTPAEQMARFDWVCSLGAMFLSQATTEGSA
jgi:hypothetical protein